jgi:cell division septation protein DedD
VFLRVVLGITLATLTCGAQACAAEASSLVFPGAPASTPSILSLKSNDTTTSDVISVMALGEPDVTYEKVSAIPGETETQHGFVVSPMVIRGGVVGSAFSVPAQGKAPAAAATPAPTPAKATASATPASGTPQKKSTTSSAAPLPASGVGKVK